MEIILAIAPAIALIITLIIVSINKKQNDKVISSSYKIKELLKLNKAIKFHNVTTKFEVSKKYDNKRNFYRVEPGYLMASEIRSKLKYFSEYIYKIKENRNHKIIYQSEIKRILDSETSIDYATLKISEKSYKRREKRLFEKIIIPPIVDCKFLVKMTYSSPTGKGNLSKSGKFNFNDMLTSYDSVSRSYLDKKTYSELAATERGEMSDSLRYDILSRDQFRCTICGASAKEGVRLHVDHIVPISKGGKTIPGNLRTLCERCNVGKSNKLPSEPSLYVCERCGARMVLRQGVNGEFYGCSNYPKCTYTKNPK